MARNIRFQLIEAAIVIAGFIGGTAAFVGAILS